MQLRFLKTITNKQQKSLARIEAIVWSNNNRRLVVAESDGIIYLYDEAGELRDKFPTRPYLPIPAGMNPENSKSRVKTYVVKGMAFSSDDVRLAVAQSDNIVFVYNLGNDWGEKKTICNNFPQNSPVTCICWPQGRPFEVVFGRADGAVRVGHLKTKKSTTLYTSESPVISIAPSLDGQGFASGHADGSIYRFYFKDIDGEGIVEGTQKIAHHPSVPQYIVWGEATLIVAGLDKKIVFYNRDGTSVQHFDYSHTKDQERDFSCITTNPSGQCVVVASFNRIRVFNFNVRRYHWEEGSVHDLANLYSVSSMTWKPDGSRLIIGNICGTVDMYDTCLKRYRHKQEFEFTYVSPSQVIVRRLSSGTRIVLKSIFGYEIIKVNVARDQFLVGHTTQTLLLGDLESCKLSEVHWIGSGNEKFFYDNPKVCLVYNAGEISVIEYGINDVIGSFRTEFISTHLISVRINYPFAANNSVIQEDSYEGTVDIMEGNKKVAFLIDSHTIRVMDLVASVLIAKISHDIKIDFLELNPRGTKLLFRDKQRHLYLYDIKTQQKTTLLSYCSYVQWVPDSDVVVAQNRDDLCVWYSIDSPERVTIVTIKGDVESIVRAQGCTAVIVDDGTGTTDYDLDEGLIEFGTAMEDRQFGKAADILEQLAIAPETEAMWNKLSEQVLKEQKFSIAERCFAAIGDVSKARFLRKLVKEMKAIEDSEEDTMDTIYHWSIRAKVAIMNKDFKLAEQIYLEQGKTEQAMQMYEQLQKFEESINIAVAKGIPNATQKKDEYMEWLIKTKQEDKAASIYEKEAKYINAINLYLQGGFPANAANVVINHSLSIGIHENLLDSIEKGLMNSHLYEKAGQFFEKRNLYEKAIDSYRKGHAFRSAVELARSVAPERVVKLEEEWGDHLANVQKQMEAAIHHYIEAGQYIKAIEAAIDSRQWNKVVQIVEGIEPSTAEKYYVKIAKYFQEIQNYQQAKKYFLKAGKFNEAMSMFESVSMWDEVQQIAETFMNEDETQTLYLKQASKLEAKQKFKEAEKLYIKVNEPDLAINMYKKNHLFEDMIRLVTQHRNVHLHDAHLQIAQQLENEGHLRQAEHHYIESGDWINAVNMYRHNDKWNDAIRVAKSHGPTNSWKKVAVDWAMTVGGENGGEAGAKLLYKLGLIEDAINYCLDRELWHLAFDMARNSLKSKLTEVHLKYAMALEDAGRLKEAEDEYINAQSPKEAIDMYIHQHDWNNAMRVAEAYDPILINYVIEQQAEILFHEGELTKAEKLYLQAKKPELIVQKYREIHRYQDAKRIAETYLSGDVLRKITSDWAEYQLSSTGSEEKSSSTMKNDQKPTSVDTRSDVTDPAAPARMFKESGEYDKAINAYLGFKWKNMDLDDEYLYQEWLSAVEIAATHVQNRLSEVVGEVAKRLIVLQRYKQAAELHAEVEQFQQAIDIFIQFGLWDLAMQLAKNKKPELIKYVQHRHKQFLMASKKPEDLIQGGNLVGAVEAYAQREEFEQCLQLAKDSKLNDFLVKYIMIYTNKLIQKMQLTKAIQIYELYGIPIEKSMIFVYLQLVKLLIWKHMSSFIYPAQSQGIKRKMDNMIKNAKDFRNIVRKCRDLVFHVLIGFKEQGFSKEIGTESNLSSTKKSTTTMTKYTPLRANFSLQDNSAANHSTVNIGLRNDNSSSDPLTHLPELLKYVEILHLLNMKYTIQCDSIEESRELYAKVCISLLRYCDFVPPDVVFYEAGEASKLVGWSGLSFVFLNRFLDIRDAIHDLSGQTEDEEEGDNEPIVNGMAELENTDFQGTDIPFIVPLPRYQCLSKEKIDEITDAILMESIDKKDVVLSFIQCENCSKGMYSANLHCQNCNHTYEPCLVTGYPVMKAGVAKCSNCNRIANGSDWNTFFMTQSDCTWCGKPQTVQQ